MPRRYGADGTRLWNGKTPEKGIYRLDSQTSLLISSELYNSFHLAALISNELLLKQVDTAFRGYIETSDVKINRLFENTLWGMKSNFLDMPTDCPQRDERLGWTAGPLDTIVTGTPISCSTASI